MVLQGLVGTLWGYGSLRLVLSRPPAMGVWCAWPEDIPTIPYLPRNRKPARDAPIGRPGGRAMSNAQLLLTNVSVKLHHERR